MTLELENKMLWACLNKIHDYIIEKLDERNAFMIEDLLQINLIISQMGPGDLKVQDRQADSN